LGNSGYDRRKKERQDDHPDQVYEQIADRFDGNSGPWKGEAECDARKEPDEYLRGER
jgi:hypothetical protein